MKKFITYIFFLTVLIISEYYFFTEIFAQKRLPVLMASSMVMLATIFGIFRFAKKNIINTKQG